MRSMHEAGGAREAYSPAEELFNRRRRTAGLVLGPIMLIGLLVLPIVAPAAGTVAQILVTDGQPVEFDQPLVVLG